MRRNRLLTVLGLSASAAAAAVAIPFLASSAPSDYLLPDLVSSAPPVAGEGGAFLIEGAFADRPGEEATSDPRGPRLLLRFDGYIDNRGDGDVRIEGNPTTRSAVQVVERADGTFVIPGSAGTDPGDAIPRPSAGYPLNNNAENQEQCVGANPTNQRPTRGPCVIYSTTDSEALSDGHNHWHVVNLARYSLWNATATAEVAPGQKVGYCMYDSATIPDWTGELEDSFYGFQGGTDNFCRQFEPNTTTLIEGIQPGRRDIYDAGLAWQWIDVTDVPPGQYRLGNQLDPGNRIWEKTGQEANAVARSELLTIPGFVAQPVAAATGLGQARQITLTALKFGGACFKSTPAQGCATYTPSDGNRVFRITDPPDNGTLNVAANSPFGNPVVTYTPNPGFGGVDSFAYTAADNASQYPRTRQAAAVSVTVGNGQALGLSISGNPGSVTAGTSVQLTPVLTNLTGGVTWSVNGVAGGNASVGTITAAGLYTAPAAVPAGGQVTVRATSVSVPAVSAQTTIAIRAAARATGQPLPVGGKRVGTLKKPLVARLGGRVVVRLAPPRSGRLTITMLRGKKRVGACVFPKAVVGRGVVCYIRTRTVRNVRIVTVLDPRRGKNARSVVVRRRI